MKKTAMDSDRAHLSRVLRDYDALGGLRSRGHFTVNGTDLTIAQVVAVAGFSADALILPDLKVKARLAKSVEALNAYLARGWTVYGVNTGYGGSADARCGDGSSASVNANDARTAASTAGDPLADLQISLMQHLTSGILPKADLAGAHSDDAGEGEPALAAYSPSHALPLAWTRAAMLVRLNQNLRGHSAVRLEVLSLLERFLRFGVTPVVPLRGTISASGDLMTMSYVVAALAGCPDVYVHCDIPKASEPSEDVNGHIHKASGVSEDAHCHIYKASEPAEEVHRPRLSKPNRRYSRPIQASVAFRQHAIILGEPVTLQPKEGLGLVNGTAPSAAAAALVLHETNRLTVLAQALTGVTAEALRGNVVWLHPFVHAARPHRGQVEVAANLRSFLAGSKMVSGLGSQDSLVRRAADSELCQDRYATRTAPQWLGPYLEDLLAAVDQIEVELNSSSDNPLVDPASGEVLSGGNFQAAVATSAMDKARLAVVAVGRLLYSQITELADVDRSNGLPANLVAAAPPVTSATGAITEPAPSFGVKGLDVNAAAYASELASLAAPVVAHVLPAEMGNQGVSSLALVTARRTADAVDLLAHLVAVSVMVACQALECRVWERKVWTRLESAVAKALSSTTSSSSASSAVMAALKYAWDRAGRCGFAARWRTAVTAAIGAAVAVAATTATGSANGHAPDHGERAIVTCLVGVLDPTSPSDVAACSSPPTPDEVRASAGAGAGRLWSCVRECLRVPFLEGIDDHPLFGRDEDPDDDSHDDDVDPNGPLDGERDVNGKLSRSRRKSTIGTFVSRIYDDLKRDDGRLTRVVLEVLRMNGAGEANKEINGEE